MNADAEFRISPSVLLAPGCDSSLRAGLLPFKIFQELFFLKNLPQCTMGFACVTFPGHLCTSRFLGRARVSGPVLDLRAWFSALGPPCWRNIDSDHVVSNASLQDCLCFNFLPPGRF
jgi:hypothetical protein